MELTEVLYITIIPCNLFREDWELLHLVMMMKWKMKKRRRIQNTVFLFPLDYFIELYKHFVKPGYKKINKKLIVFDNEDGTVFSL